MYFQLSSKSKERQGKNERKKRKSDKIGDFPRENDNWQKDKKAMFSRSSAVRKHHYEPLGRCFVTRRVGAE